MTTATPRLFIDVHVLQTVPPSCINRDDTGSPKSAVYGGVKRARVSSQAWKKATRDEFKNHLDVSQLGERTKRVVERIADRMRELDANVDPERATLAATDVLEAAGIKVNVEKKKGKGDEESTEERRTGYLVFLSRAQIDALAEIGLTVVAGEKPDKKLAKQAFGDENSIDVALFGRMIAEAPELNVDAACQVSHAISVHAVATEFDYFTAVDDNAPDDNAGAGMIGTVEFVSSTLYRYATIDAVRLSENLDSADAAVQAIAAFIRAFILSMPTGKQNTFANRTRPGLVLIEVRQDQPVNLAAAFEEPIRADGGILALAAERLTEQAILEDRSFGTEPLRSGLLVSDAAAKDKASPILARAEAATLDQLVLLASEAAQVQLKGE